MSIQMYLVRVCQSHKGTFGVLVQDEMAFALTFERPWLDNRQQVSSIPPGSYRCRRIQSPRFGEVFEVMAVPGRTNILFHRGNGIVDTAGCILVGEEFAGTLALPILASSQRGYTEFMLRLDGQPEFELTVIPPPILVAGPTEV